mmetsp:Transcript_70263/g.131403  ORF Transcript_70263/g.131403 Transcript_70263/m.131403 type:complete len:468 (-) Transcript_70263:79-1482(-)
MAGMQLVLPLTAPQAGQRVSSPHLQSQPVAAAPLAQRKQSQHPTSFGLALGVSVAATRTAKRRGNTSKVLVRALPFRGKKKDSKESEVVKGDENAGSPDIEEEPAADSAAADANEEESGRHDEVKACPTCYCRLSSGCYCPRCRVGYPRQAASDGNYIDLTIAAAIPVTNEDEAVKKCLAASNSSTTTEKERRFSRLPGVAQLDALAKAANLPTSSDLEDLAREVAKDAEKVIPQGQLQQSTFESPLVSFIYERGWRQQFRQSGFPGPDAEYTLAKGFLLATPRISHAQGSESLAGPLLDCSCGSGVFTRRFASDEALPFQRLIALDFSESMLKQVDTTCSKEAGGTDYPEYARPLELIRGDVTRLPFESGSLSGIHAGAAIHCWPNPEVAMAELARVLQPGAGLVLSTFRTNSVIRFNRSFRLWKEEELRELCKKVGLVNIKVELREPAFIMISAEKPTDETDVAK